jgi:hypothetical protein
MEFRRRYYVGWAIRSSGVLGKNKVRQISLSRDIPLCQDVLRRHGKTTFLIGGVPFVMRA